MGVSCLYQLEWRVSASVLSSTVVCAVVMSNSCCSGVHGNQGKLCDMLKAVDSESDEETVEQKDKDYEESVSGWTLGSEICCCSHWTVAWFCTQYSSVYRQYQMVPSVPISGDGKVPAPIPIPALISKYLNDPEFVHEDTLSLAKMRSSVSECGLLML